MKVIAEIDASEGKIKAALPRDFETVRDAGIIDFHTEQTGYNGTVGTMTAAGCQKGAVEQDFCRSDFFGEQFARYDPNPDGSCCV